MQRYWDGTAWSEQRRPEQPIAVLVPATGDAQAAGNGFAVAALVCGIVGAVLGLVPWTFWLAWIVGVVAIVFGAIGRRRADGEPIVGRRSMATAGLVLGIVAIALGIIGLIVLMTWISGATDAIDGFERCVSDPNALNCD